mmetsp:Transcript_62192/g.131404  ORF Transcript_62192/g.131404 Transcript_62192/m.131404 type:complete len:844 (-) Transcript_62192:138-2669(-)
MLPAVSKMSPLRKAFFVVWVLAVSFVVYLNLLHHRPDPLLHPEGTLASELISEGQGANEIQASPLQCGDGKSCSSASAAVSSQNSDGCCWQLGGSRMRVEVASHPSPHWRVVEARDVESDAFLPLGGQPLFQLFAPEQDSRKHLGIMGGRMRQPAGSSKASKRDRQAAAVCAIVALESQTSLELQLRLKCAGGHSVDFRLWLPDEDSHYFRVQVSIWAEADATKNKQQPTYGTLRLFSLKSSLIEETMGRAEDRQMYRIDPIDGLPVLVNSRFFVGVEHPLSSTYDLGVLNRTHVKGFVGEVNHLAQLPRPTKDEPWTYRMVIGSFSERNQARRAFVDYLHAERPGRRTPMVHYNSWYDFYSYQDEGFNGGFKDPIKNPTLAAKLRQEKMDETSCLNRVDAFGIELVKKRQTRVDSFLWDDGWDDPESLWQFDSKRFPNKFDPIRERSESYGIGTGVWISPWGGYGFPQEARVSYGKRHGWETNWNAAVGTEGFSLAGPKYRDAFRKLALGFVEDQAVNLFKFDGVAGDPRELAVEMEAMMRLITDLRATTAKLPGKGSGKPRNADDAIWINLTTGTWASPFFLFWADSIWRGGPDIASRNRDWMPDPGYRSDGLSRRQRWIRWRNMIVYLLVVLRSSFFPLSQLMIHGVIVASHGDALHFGLDQYDEVDFAQEVWSFVALGLQLQELYVAPRNMLPEAWDCLAEGLQWARREAAVLRDSHWVFGDPAARDVYSTAAWSVQQGRGFMMLHNPTGASQLSAQFDLRSVLELPRAQSSGTLEVRVVKSIYRPPESTEGRWEGWTCSEVPPSHDEHAPHCLQDALENLQIRLHPTEVLVLEFSKGA